MRAPLVTELRFMARRFVYTVLRDDKRYRKRAQVALRRLDREAIQARRRTPLIHNGKKARR